jgi:mRNA-degrading endonuclease toxin of MazEF toxin-antitoxin module
LILVNFDRGASASPSAGHTGKANSQPPPQVGDRADAVLADQVKSLDWSVRKAKYKGKATPAELAEVRAKIAALIGG